MARSLEPMIPVEDWRKSRATETSATSAMVGLSAAKKVLGRRKQSINGKMVKES